jgi:hypothetical protein
VGVTARVLVDRDEARHASAALIFGSHCVTGALRGDHQHVEVGARLDEVEVDIEPVGEHERGTLFHIGRKLIAVDLGLQFIGRQHHHDIRPFGGSGDLHHLDAFGLRLFGGSRARPERDRDLFHAAVAHIENMRVALAAVADHRHFLGFDQIEIGVSIIIHTHVLFSLRETHFCGDIEVKRRHAGRWLLVNAGIAIKHALRERPPVARQDNVIAGGLMVSGALWLGSVPRGRGARWGGVGNGRA